MAKKDNRPKYGYRPTDILRRELIPQGPYNRAVGPRSNTPAGAWDRKAGETVRQYMAFDVFRRLGAGRTLERTKEILWEGRRLGLLPTSPKIEARVKRSMPSERTGRTSGDESALHACTQPLAMEKRDRRIMNSHIYKWANDFNWVERAQAWDDHIYELLREDERRLRREDSARMAAANRSIREKMLQISMKLLEQVLERLTSGEHYAPKDLRDLVLAAERTGLIRDNAFKGVKDLLDEGDQDGQLDSRVAVRLLEAMAGIAQESEAAQPLSLDGPVIDVTPEP